MALRLDFGLTICVPFSRAKLIFPTNLMLPKNCKAAVDFLDIGFEVASPYLRNRTVVQSLITLTGRLIGFGKGDGHEKTLAKFIGEFMDELSRQVELGADAKDADYIDFQKTVTANRRGGPKTRQEILLRKLLASNPAFSTLLDPASVEESGLLTQIKRDAEAIIRLIGSINSQYSAEKGEYLFKPTNKTALSQHELSQRVLSYDDYESLINNLYFCVS